MSFNSNTIRSQFPLLTQKVHGYPLVYLDSGATSKNLRLLLMLNPRFTAQLMQVFTAVHTN